MNEVPFQKPPSIRAQRKTFSLPFALEPVCAPLLQIMGGWAVRMVMENGGLFISPSGISELDFTTTKTATAERSILIGRESLQVFFVLGALAYF